MYAIAGARIHTAGPKGTLDNATVIIDGERIVDVAIKPTLPSDCRVFDGTGCDVVPGFVDAHSHVGLDTQGISVPDANETSSLVNPHLHVLDAFNPAEGGLSCCLSGGVTTACILPGSPVRYGPMAERIGVVSGIGSVVKTRVSQGRPTILREHAALKMALGEHPKRYARELRKPLATRMNIAALCRETLDRGRAYEGDRRFEHIAALLKGDFPAAIHVHRVSDIHMALRLTEEYGFQTVLHHVTEGHMVTEDLLRAGVPCVVGPIVIPRRGGELRNLTLAGPVALSAAGVEVAIMSDHPTYPGWHLPYHAGVLVREGMSHDDALRTITLNPARILGVSDRVGSLEAGKDADLVVFRGDPLEIVSAIVAVVADGQVSQGRMAAVSPDRHGPVEGRVHP